MFTLFEVDGASKWYRTDDDIYNVLERQDGVFLIYKLRENEYIYTGIKYHSLQECENAIKG